MKREYHKELCAAIKNRVPQMRFVGYFNDQYNKEKQEQSIDDPSCLLSYKPQDFKNPSGGLGLQNYNLLVTAYISITNYADAGDEILDFAEQVNQVMHMFVPSSALNTFGKLVRVDERPNYDHDQRIVHEIDYLVEVRDFTCDKRNTKEVTATPVVTATYQ